MSDTATARFLEQWLQREYPGTAWHVDLEPPQDGIASETLPWKISGTDTDRVDNKEVGVAA